MLKRIKDINEALPGMLLIECIYLVVAQIIIFIAVPNKKCVQWDCWQVLYMPYSVHFI